MLESNISTNQKSVNHEYVISDRPSSVKICNIIKIREHNKTHCESSLKMRSIFFVPFRLLNIPLCQLINVSSQDCSYSYLVIGAKFSLMHTYTKLPSAFAQGKHGMYCFLN